MKAFIDTNVPLGVLARREPFYEDSAAIWSLAEQGKLEGVGLGGELREHFFPDP